MNKIRSLMSEKSIRFTDIQEKTGLSQSTLTRVLSKNGIPNSTKLETLKKIASVLKCPINEVLTPNIAISKINIDKPKKANKYTGRITFLVDSVKVDQPFITAFTYEKMLNSLTQSEGNYLSRINIQLLPNAKGETLGRYFSYISNEHLGNIAEKIINACNYPTETSVDPILETIISFQIKRSLCLSTFDISFQDGTFKIIK